MNMLIGYQFYVFYREYHLLLPCISRNIILTLHWKCELKILVYYFFRTFIQWKTNSSVLIRIISGYLENVWYLSTKLGLFQNLWALSQYTRAFMFVKESTICYRWNFIQFDVFNVCKRTASRKKWLKMVNFYVHLNRADGHYARSITFKNYWIMLNECAKLFVFISDL